MAQIVDNVNEDRPPLPVQSIAAIIWLTTSRRKDRTEAAIIGRRVKAYARTIDVEPLLEGLRAYAAAGYHALGFTAQAARDRSAAARERLRDAEKQVEESEVSLGWERINVALVAHGLPTVNGSLLGRIPRSTRSPCDTAGCSGFAVPPFKHCGGCLNRQRRKISSAPARPRKEFLEDAE